MNNEQIIGNLLNKFVTEEIMTKSEFRTEIDAIMDKHEAKIDAQFDKIDVRFNHNNTLIISTGVVIVLSMIGFIMTMILTHH